MSTPPQPPFVLYSDGNGNVYEDTSLYACGRSGHYAGAVSKADWIALPSGGSLYELPGRRAVGIDVETGEMRICEEGWAVAAFIPPAYASLHLASYINQEDAPTLTLFCDTIFGWLDAVFNVSKVRVVSDCRQEGEGIM